MLLSAGFRNIIHNEGIPLTLVNFGALWAKPLNARIIVATLLLLHITNKWYIIMYIYNMSLLYYFKGVIYNDCYFEWTKCMAMNWELVRRKGRHSFYVMGNVVNCTAKWNTNVVEWTSVECKRNKGANETESDNEIRMYISE